MHYVEWCISLSVSYRARVVDQRNRPSSSVWWMPLQAIVCDQVCPCRDAGQYRTKTRRGSIKPSLSVDKYNYSCNFIASEESPAAFHIVLSADIRRQVASIARRQANAVDAVTLRRHIFHTEPSQLASRHGALEKWTFIRSFTVLGIRVGCWQQGTSGCQRDGTRMYR